MTHLKNPRVAVIGATGMAGRELIRILEERNFLLSSLDLYASNRSAGTTIDFRGESLFVEELIHAEQINADIAFFAAGSKPSLSFADKLARRRQSQSFMCREPSLGTYANIAWSIA